MAKHGQAELRKKLTTLGVPYRFRVNGSKKHHCLTNDEMERIVRRFDENERGKARMLEEVAEPGIPARRRAIAFWHGRELPQCCFFGLKSAVQVGYEVLLATYEEYHLPAGVKRLDAGLYLPKDQFEKLLELEVQIVHIADYIRFLACSDIGGWFQDADVVHLRMGDGLPQPSTAWHVLGSLRARPGCRQGAEKDWRTWQTNFLSKPQDRLHLASPFFIPPNSPWVQAILKEMDRRFFEEKKGFADYNGVMKLAQSMVSAYGLHDAVMGPEAWCPIDYWKNPLTDRASISDVDALLQESYGVAAFWQSGRQGRDQDATAVPGSTWARLMDRVVDMAKPSRRHWVKCRKIDHGLAHKDHFGKIYLGVFRCEEAIPEELTKAESVYLREHVAQESADLRRFGISRECSPLQATSSLVEEKPSSSAQTAHTKRQMRDVATQHPERVVIYGSLISSSRDAQRAFRLLQRMRDSKLVPNVVNYTAVLTAYGRRGDFHKATELLEEMRQAEVVPNIISWNALLDSFVKGDGNATRCLNDMVQRKMEPNVVSFTSMIDYHSRRADPEAAELWLLRMRSLQLRPSAVTFTAVLKGYAKTGQVDEAAKVLRRMALSQQSLDVVAWTGLLSACAAAKRWDVALCALRWMRQLQVSPNQITHQALKRLGLAR